MRSVGFAGVMVVAGTIGLSGSLAQAADMAYKGDPTYAKAEATDRQWTLTVGGYVMAQPVWAGSDDYEFGFKPIISITRADQLSRFNSFNDNPSLALWDTGTFEAGIVGKIDWKRDSSSSNALRGMSDIDYAVEVGGYAQWFPVDWLRLRGELRYGFGGFDGVVADLAVDAIHFSPELWGVTLSAGPRMTLASSGYIDTYYGITPGEAAFAQALGNPLTPYQAGGGIYSVGFGGQVVKRFTENITGSVFAEYKYLMDDAADSPLVVQNGDRNQFQTGVSLSYTFFLGFE
ncbi:MipA/OmpV family protein [Ancylobacter dichloromethanicus]|uniref:MltA-interacting MipA family protein n=1 Tax=Ancylobacter dichloromethanicus TaxID=518825 RepID=A0A9W6J7Z2_9HYPH|nr:MipA/OmpV family protein [Ancylobacter dichloromethanicus]MBS7553944.1 MipA/OmpV family protein [Ancylobacter dichloromethanicus]GLK71054.1 MltA-interacting MipA family protein [Ancylobacter dichloromethanicus]